MRNVLPKNLYISFIFLLITFPVLAQGIQRTTRGSVGEGIYTKADSAFLRNDFESAIIELDNSISINDTNAQVFYNRGLMERLTSRGSGLEYFQKSVDMGDLYYAHWRLGEAFTISGNLEQGEYHLRKAVDMNKELHEAWVALGENLCRQEKYEEAIKALTYSIKETQNYPQAYTTLARVFLKQNKTKEAIAVLLEGHERFPFESVLTEIIRYYHRNGMADSIKHYGEEYLRTYPMGPHLNEVLLCLEKANPDSEYIADGIFRDIAFPEGMQRYSAEELLPVGKQLQYDVKYAFLKLGELFVDCVEGEFKGKPSWRVRYIVKTNPSVPLVDINDTFYVHLDKELRHTMYIDMRYHESSFSGINIYECDYEQGNFIERTINGDGEWFYVRYPLPPNVFDASSMLWYAQQLVAAGVSGVASNEISSSFEQTIINVHGQDGKREYAGNEYKTVKVDGILRYSSLAGLTGDYLGWYMGEPPYWPLHAKFRIFLGSIVIKFKGVYDTELEPGPGWHMSDLYKFNKYEK